MWFEQPGHLAQSPLLASARGSNPHPVLLSTTRASLPLLGEGHGLCSFILPFGPDS